MPTLCGHFAPKRRPVDPKTGIRAAPVRTIVRRQHRGFVCLFHSQKSAIPIECESLLELDFVRLVEVDHDITSIIHQPREISWTLDGVTHLHIPDFEITYKRNPVVVEVKPRRRAALPAVLERTKIVTRDLAEKGVLYRILTETFIRREPQLSYAKLVLRGLAHDPAPHDRQAVLGILAHDFRGLTTVDICHQLQKPPFFVNTILAMVLRGDLCFAECHASSGIRQAPSAAEAVVRIRRSAP